MKATTMKIGPSDWKLHWKELLLVSTLILAAPFLQGGITPLTTDAEGEFLQTAQVSSQRSSLRIYRSEPHDVATQVLHGPMQRRSEMTELEKGLRSEAKSMREAGLSSSEMESQIVRGPSQTR